MTKVAVAVRIIIIAGTEHTQKRSEQPNHTMPHNTFVADNRLRERWFGKEPQGDEAAAAK